MIIEWSDVGGYSIRHSDGHLFCRRPIGSFPMLAQKRISDTISIAGGHRSPKSVVSRLNIPSHRFHDASRPRWIAGAWRWRCRPGCSGGDGSRSVQLPRASGRDVGSSGICLDGGPLEVDPFDPSLDVNGNPKQPEMPWPRFHPGADSARFWRHQPVTAMRRAFGTTAAVNRSSRPKSPDRTRSRRQKWDAAVKSVNLAASPLRRQGQRSNCSDA